MDKYLLTWPTIDASVVNYGIVSVFFANVSGGWTACPFTQYQTSSLSYTVNYRYNVDTVELSLQHSDLSNNTAPFTTATFKFVAVSGAARQAHPLTNWHDYNEVMAVMKEYENQ